MGCVPSNFEMSPVDSHVEHVQAPAETENCTDLNNLEISKPTTDHADTAKMPENESTTQSHHSVGKLSSNVGPILSNIGIPSPTVDVNTGSTLFLAQEHVPALKKGYLFKQGHVVRNWKKRFFVLENGWLMYFVHATHVYPYGLEEKGKISLRGAKIVLEGNNKINITLQDRLKQFIVSIRYPTEREEWYIAIKNHIKYCSEAKI
jgi:hypothetical protein